MKLLRGISDTWHAITSIKRDWSTYTPKQKWQLLYDLGSRTGYIVGLRFYGDLKVIPYTYMMLMIVVVYAVFVIYTFYYYSVRGQTKESLPCLSISGLYLTVCVVKIFNLKDENLRNMKIYLFISLTGNNGIPTDHNRITISN